MSAFDPASIEKTHANIFAERAVCAALARMEPLSAAISIAEHSITADLFAAYQTRELFTAIRLNLDNGLPVDPATLTGLVDGATLVEFETCLSEHASAANLASYVKLLIECQRERERQRLTAALVTAANAGDMVAVDSCRDRIAALEADNGKQRDHHFQWADDFCQQPPEVNYLVSGILDLNSTGCIVGDSQAGKSFIAVDRACHIANGMSWLGRKTKAGIVLYVIGEGADGTRKRIKAWHDHYGLPISNRLAIRTVPAALCHPESAIELIDGIKALLAGMDNPLLIELDTLNRNFGVGDENSTKDMTAFVRGMDSLRRATSAHVSTVHHFGKADKGAARGSVVLESSMDFSYHIKKTGDPQNVDSLTTTMGFRKLKDRQPPPDVAWRWQSVDLPWLDENGHRQNSIVLIPTESTQSTQSILLTRPQRIAMETLTAGIANGADHMLIADWRNAAFNAGISQSTSKQGRYAAFTRAIETLVDNRMVTIDENRCYPYRVNTVNTQSTSGQYVEFVDPGKAQIESTKSTHPLKGVDYVDYAVPQPAKAENPTAAHFTVLVKTLITAGHSRSEAEQIAREEISTMGVAP